MKEFLLSSANYPFTISLTIMFIIAALEIISASLGMGLSEMVDSVLPEIDMDIDADIDADVDLHAPGAGPDGLVKLLAWFRIGEVPVIILFIIFLTGFGLSGLIVQFTAIKLIGTTIPSIIAAIPAILFSIPTVRVCGGFLGKHMPKDETYVVSEKSFLGLIATITMGTAHHDVHAQAKLKDKHGQTHYILVVPDNPDDSFSQGETVIVVSQNGSKFNVIANTSSALTD